MSQSVHLQSLSSASLSEEETWADNSKNLIAFTKTEFGWSA